MHRESESINERLASPEADYHETGAIPDASDARAGPAAQSPAGAAPGRGPDAPF